MRFETKTKDHFPPLATPTSAPTPIYLCSFWHICVVLNARFRSTDVVMENRKRKIRKTLCFAMLISMKPQQYAL